MIFEGRTNVERRAVDTPTEEQSDKIAHLSSTRLRAEDGTSVMKRENVENERQQGLSEDV